MKQYLATTGNSDIWDLDGEVLLLGPWCLSGAEKKDPETYTVCPSPWDSARSIKEAAIYCHKIYEDIMQQLGKNLNLIHQIDRPAKYWRLLLGHWLLHFTGIFYDRYKRIENACMLFPKFYTHVLSGKEYDCAPLDSYDFLFNCKDQDSYNLKLFTVICNELCPKNTVEKEIAQESKTLIHRYGIKRRLFYYFMDLFNFFVKTPVILSEMHHLTPLDMLILKARAGLGAVGFMDFDPTPKQISADGYSSDMRRQVMLKGPVDSFQALLHRAIPQAIPKCYLEHFKIYRDSVMKVRPAGIIGSAIGWYFNERFKFYAAESVTLGAKIVEFLHGGNYGFSFSMPTEAILAERDIFYAWGWAPGGDTKMKNLPSIHFSKIKDTYRRKVNKILFISQTTSKYMFRFHTVLSPDHIAKYFEDKKSFFSHLPGGLQEKILYRPYPDDDFWQEATVIKKIIPGAKFLLGASLTEWMKQVRLVVIDHAHTSFLEALSINVPCVFYWDHSLYAMREEAEEYFGLLRGAGILHESPESAANKVKEIYDNPSEWWRDIKTQDARQKFCGRFALASADWPEEWARELNGLRDKFNGRAQ